MSMSNLGPKVARDSLDPWLSGALLAFLARLAWQPILPVTAWLPFQAYGQKHEVHLMFTLFESTWRPWFASLPGVPLLPRWTWIDSVTISLFAFLYLIVRPAGLSRPGGPSRMAVGRSPVTEERRPLSPFPPFGPGGPSFPGLPLFPSFPGGPSGPGIPLTPSGPWSPWSPATPATPGGPRGPGPPASPGSPGSPFNTRTSSSGRL